MSILSPKAQVFLYLRQRWYFLLNKIYLNLPVEFIQGQIPPKSGIQGVSQGSSFIYCVLNINSALPDSMQSLFVSCFFGHVPWDGLGVVAYP